MNNPILKNEQHVTVLPREIDVNLARALGHLVVAFGRLEDMLKIAIKRTEQTNKLEDVIREFEGKSLGSLITSCRKRCPSLAQSCDKAVKLNQQRQDFIHATFAATEKGRYVRFRQLVGYEDLAKDIATIETVTKEANALIEELDQATGALVSNRSNPDSGVVTVSVLGSRLT
jgi:hypothetical protein